jgi:glyoxylase I family protein
MTRAEDIAQHLRDLEQALLDPMVRSDRIRVGELLADDFVEFGSSGRVWTRDGILDLLAGEIPGPIHMRDFECALLAEDVALITYRASRTEASTGTELSSLRSSIWTKKTGGWRLRFHQGTRTS